MVMRGEPIWVDAFEDFCALRNNRKTVNDRTHILFLVPDADTANSFQIPNLRLKDAGQNVDYFTGCVGFLSGDCIFYLMDFICFYCFDILTPFFVFFSQNPRGKVDLFFET